MARTAEDSHLLLHGMSLDLEALSSSGPKRTEDEVRDHLFLKCRFSTQIWTLALARIDPAQTGFITWAELLSWSRFSTQAAPATLRRLLTHGMVFHLWRQRNNVLHNNVHLSPLQMFKLMDRDIKNAITARQHKRNFRGLMCLWIR
ncbi:uncharacterized protein LOC125584119 [Brassica napus]|uniref:uncharacterized protein LOC125584119 n=1 Tax=Brassica napus TaxID=3708 RepID=UPI002078B4C4|nr:uncharacterized protein LOC125584119 [Brassica napus]